MTQNTTNYLQNTKEVLVSVALIEHCVSSWITYGLNRAIYVKFWSILILLISNIPNVSNKIYHDKEENIFFRKHRRTGEYNIVSYHGSATAYNRESLGNVYSLYFINVMSSQ